MNAALIKKSLFFVLALLIFAMPVKSQSLLTEHEKTGFDNFTSHENMIQFLQDDKSTSSEMFLGYYGTSILGNDLPYAVFSRPIATNPFEAMTSGKPIVILDAVSHVHTTRRI
ncbi:MAG: hypothetical protein GY845_30630 [Planctomycetes bacterium]|nr:hypothetical protein [Planctomycetota bacterium]